MCSGQRHNDGLAGVRGPLQANAILSAQRKALIEALVAQVKITGPGRVVPTFRIPQPQAGPPSKHSVRALTNLVGWLVGLTCQHPNPLIVADGPELMIRAVRERRI
jgi:hypothetical protein